MEYAKTVLSGVAGIMLALIGVTIWLARGTKATGMAVLVALFLDFRFWALAAVLSALFFAASRLQNKLLKGFLFWTPTIAITTIGLMLCGLITYAVMSRPRP